MLRLELYHLEAHLEAHPPGFAAFRRDCLVEVLYQLHVVPARNRARARYLATEPRAYLPLSAQLLRHWLPDYRQYLAYALASGLLETDNHYIPGEKCRGYRYSAPYRRGGARSGFRVVRLRDEVLLNRLRQLQTTTPAPRWSRCARKEYAPVLDCLRPGTCALRIHAAAALAFIAAARDAAERNPAEREAKPKHRRPAKLATTALTTASGGTAAPPPSVKARRRGRPRNATGTETKDPNEQYQQRFTSVAQLDARDFRYSIDPYGRLHTVLTRLSAPLRRFVYLEGAPPLVAIDLRSSQPFLVNLLLNETFLEKPWKKGRRGTHPPITLWHEGRSLAEEAAEEDGAVRRRLLTASSSEKASKRLPAERAPRRPKTPGQAGTNDAQTRAQVEFIVERSRQLLGITGTGSAQCRPDVEEFRRLTGSGEFYEQMQRSLGLALGQNPVSRGTVKQMMFEVLFSQNVVETDIKVAFTRLFPTVDAVLRTYKHEDHRALPRLLQTLESNLLLRKLVPLVRKRWPDLPGIFTVHDSVIVPVTYASQVEELMRKHLSRWVGVVPQFRREAWGSEAPPTGTP